MLTKGTGGIFPRVVFVMEKLYLSGMRHQANYLLPLFVYSLILPILISSATSSLLLMDFRAFFFFTYGESFLAEYLILLTRDKTPEFCTFFVKRLTKFRLFSLPVFTTSTLVVMASIVTQSVCIFNRFVFLNVF